MANGHWQRKIDSSGGTNMAVFTVRATQYISGSGPSAEFEIVVRHSVHKKNLYERTKKAS